MIGGHYPLSIRRQFSHLIVGHQHTERWKDQPRIPQLWGAKSSLLGNTWSVVQRVDTPGSCSGQAWLHSGNAWRAQEEGRGWAESRAVRPSETLGWAWALSALLSASVRKVGLTRIHLAADRSGARSDPGRARTRGALRSSGSQLAFWTQ